MYTIRGLVALFLLAVVGACAGKHAPTSTDADVAAIRELNTKWIAAQVAGDVDGMVAPLTDDFVLLPPNEAPQTGIPAARAWVEKLLSQATITSGTAVLDEVAVAGDLAFARGTFNSTMQPKTGGSPAPGASKYALLLRRQGDGSWRIARDIWNAAPVPPTK